MTPLAGTRALITGGSRGIGAACAEALAAAGHPVLLCYRTGHEAARAVAARIEARGGRAELLAFDVTDRAACEAALAPFVADDAAPIASSGGAGAVEPSSGVDPARLAGAPGPPIGVLVINAGVTRDAPFPALDPDAWEVVTRTALDGFYNVARLVVPGLVRRRAGRVITMSSVSGVVGNRGQVNYGAAKAGLIGATRALAQELAKRGITVNAIAPGMIDTDMLRTLPDLDAAVERVPMRRLGRPEEVAALVRFLASDDAGYITGQVIGINGGLI